MVKLNRNAACSCGSGNKYKRCCLPRDQEAAAQRRQQAAAEKSPSLPTMFDFDDDDDKLVELSNSVVDLIHEGRLDEAEDACNQLKRDFPDVIDWIERTGAVHEARGQNDKAVEYYRRCLKYIDDHPDLFEEASKDWYRRSIKRLEAGTASEPGA